MPKEHPFKLTEFRKHFDAICAAYVKGLEGKTDVTPISFDKTTFNGELQGDLHTFVFSIIHNELPYTYTCDVSQFIKRTDYHVMHMTVAANLFQQFITDLCTDISEPQKRFRN